MTLKEFYDNLPEATYPKKEFIKRLAEECNVSTGAVRRWIHEGKIPRTEHQPVILDITNQQIIFNKDELQNEDTPRSMQESH